MVELSALQQRYGAELTESTFRDNRRIVVPASKVYDVLTGLKQDFGFNLLIDITAIDYLDYPDAEHRFGVVYLLQVVSTTERLIVKTFLDLPKPQLPSVYSLWKGSDWMEREVYDMFGITFVGHPDLRRILMPDEFTAFPLRKDYPLQGRGERHNFPVLTRAES
ncbi:NADH-quinone oxidoreductase subunit C [Planctomicrobium piriforme]|uniref:NADH-quinone oxidoreductase subunit C n=1 Tax=Planctomicrobium piriforme TaxID=1576369 RepID=A0A1I3QRB6_9PLAN|nr:NADH-quinone oxidoreductase subunit C [Planctomicrobium piriforme]SFJ36684.1 NADH-quinone oxidoreductase subunit C [Planctomicrobium piriforme]